MLDIQLVRTELTRQDARIDASSLRKKLLSKGWGHCFYGGGLWIIPVNGTKINLRRVKAQIRALFVKSADCYIEVVSDFDDDFVWCGLGVILTRDALRFALNRKYQEHVKLFVKGLKVYDLQKISDSSIHPFTKLGISLARIFRVDQGRLGIAPKLIFDVMDAHGNIVKDKNLRRDAIYRASRHGMEKHQSFLKNMCDHVFPLVVKFADKTLRFEFSALVLRTQKKPKPKRGLEKWLN